MSRLEREHNGYVRCMGRWGGRQQVRLVNEGRAKCRCREFVVKDGRLYDSDDTAAEVVGYWYNCYGAHTCAVTEYLIVSVHGFATSRDFVASSNDPARRHQRDYDNKIALEKECADRAARREIGAAMSRRDKMPEVESPEETQFTWYKDNKGWG